MRAPKYFFVSMIISLVAMPVAAQQRGAAPASGPAMTLTVPGSPTAARFP